VREAGVLGDIDDRRRVKTLAGEHFYGSAAECCQ
jgi:hypothetical protein